MALHVAVTNAKTDANARMIMAMSVPILAKLATGLNGANVTRHVHRKAEAEGVELERNNVIKQLVEMQQRRRRWRKWNAHTFPNVRLNSAKVDAAIGRSGESAQRLAEEGYSTGTARKVGWTKR